MVESSVKHDVTDQFEALAAQRREAPASKQEAVTDEMVERAFNVLWKGEWSAMHPWALAGEGPREAMRAALEAALGSEEWTSDE